jgi:orotate phosphoribosyltransferase
VSLLTHRAKFLKTLVKDAYQYRNEPFTLKSGKTSHHYVDCRKVLLVPMHRQTACELIAARLINEGIEADTISGVALGGIPLADELSRQLMVNACYVRPEAKEHGKKKQVELPAWNWKRTILVEDVVTTGGSTIRAVQALHEADVTVLAVVALVDRGEGGMQRIVEETGVYHPMSIYQLHEITDEYEAQARQGHP